MKYSVYLLTFLLVPAFSHTAETKPSQMRHYITHIATDGLSHIAAVASVMTGIAVGAALKDKSEALTIASFLSGFGTAGYIKYKTPQWTDTYVLKNDIKRTTPENILTFICRVLIPFPIGTVVGELALENDLMASQK